MGRTEQLKPVQIAPSVWHVGRRDSSNPFYANPYLRILPGRKSDKSNNIKGRRVSSVLIDPGSSSDFAFVQSKVMQLVGDMSRVSGVFLNHQNPDAGSSTSQIIGRYSPKAYVITSEDVWQLIQNSNIPARNFINTRAFHYPGGFTLADKRFHAVATPFCHFSGAVMLYDPETRVLFSGSLLSGFDESAQQSLWAQEEDWEGIKRFHQTFMPNTMALQMAVASIRELMPAVEVIAPQHGKVLRGKTMHTFLDRIANLPVGIDLLLSKPNLTDNTAWNTILNRAVNTLASITEIDEVQKLLSYPGFTSSICLKNEQLFILEEGKSTLEKAITFLATGLESFLSAPMIYEVVSGCDELGLAMPQLNVEAFAPNVIMGEK